MNNKNLLAVKSFQETLHGGYCGPASLKMVLEYWEDMIIRQIIAVYPKEYK